MDSILKGMFGGGGNDDHQAGAQDFVSRYEQGAPYTGFTGDEAAQRYQQVAGQLPPDQLQSAAEQAYGRMPTDQRSQLGQMLQQQMGVQGGAPIEDPRELAGLTAQFHQQNPGGLAGLFGGGGGGGGLGGMLSGAMGGGQQQSGGGGMGGMLDNPLAKAALGGIAAMAVKKMIDNR